VCSENHKFCWAIDWSMQDTLKCFDSDIWSSQLHFGVV